MQFMATAILKAINKKTTIPHILRFDLESFGWVLAYSHGRSHYSKNHQSLPDERFQAFRAQFVQNFGRNSTLEVYKARAVLLQNPLDTAEFPELFSLPMTRLFDALQEKFYAYISHDLKPRVYSPPQPALSYEFFLTLLDTAITDLTRFNEA